MATVLLIGTFVVPLVLLLAANAFFLRLGSRWAMIPNVTFGRAAWATVAVALVDLILMAPLGCAHFLGWGWLVLILVLQIVLSLGLTWLIIARVLKTSVSRAFVAWLPTLIPAVCLCAVALFVARLCLFEAFKISSNSMAPTILGQHWEAPCPRCGSPAYCTPENERFPSNQPVLMICSKEHHSCEVANPSHVEHESDRIIVSKFLHPQRWDVIVFRLPEDPTIKYCTRLVGLPGETVTIGDGAVWIDGKKQTPPESCQCVEYLDHFGPWAGDFWGGKAKPAKLGPDEYFVLGDFSARAKDSRLWQKGAPGHPPYAVPASYIVGVATHIYWPPDRCRALR
jgi:signal peptidase I